MKRHRSATLFLVASCIGLPSAALAQPKQPDGAACSAASDCLSNYCYPGPYGNRLCLAEELNCPKPQSRGIAWGEYYFFSNGIHFCKSPQGIASAPIRAGDIDILMYDLKFGSNLSGGWTGRIAEQLLGRALDAAGASVGTPPGLGMFAARRVLPSGDESDGMTTLGIDNNRFAYCTHDMRVMSINPESGSKRPRYGIADVNDDSLRVRFRVPAGGLGQGRGWLVLRVTLVAAKKERIGELRSSGLCKPVAGRIAETYSW